MTRVWDLGWGEPLIEDTREEPERREEQEPDDTEYDLQEDK